MKTILLLILNSVIPMLEAAGHALEADNTHPEKVLIGEGLDFGGQFLQFLTDKAHGKPATPPALPASIYPEAAQAQTDSTDEAATDAGSGA